MRTFGEFLRAARLAKGMTIEGMRSRMIGAKCSSTYLHMLEVNQRQATHIVQLHLLNALGCPLTMGTFPHFLLWQLSWFEGGPAPIPLPSVSDCSGIYISTKLSLDLTADQVRLAPASHDQMYVLERLQHKFATQAGKKKKSPATTIPADSPLVLTKEAS